MPNKIVRLTYKQINEKLKESDRFYSIKWKKYYRVRLYIGDKQNLKFKVVDDNNSTVRRGEGYTNMNVLRRVTRRAMIELGVPFESEVGRKDRTFGLCKKGYTQKEHRKNRR